MVMVTLRVAIVHDDYQRVESGPPYPSGCLPLNVSMGGPHTILIYIMEVW
jgi:hypothetical protein